MKLTVIVTVYNIAEYLPRFFDSMRRQTFEDYVLIVLDDGSEDNSLEVCRAFEKNDSRIRVIASEHLGIAGIKNKAMEYIDTPYVAYVDGDDYVEPGYLEHLMTAIEKYDADLSISRVQYHLESGIVEGEFPSRGEVFITADSFTDMLPMLLDDRRLNYVYGKVYRASILKTIRVEPDVRQGMDTMINFMYLENARSIVLVDDLDYHYIRYQSRSITSYSGKDAFERLIRINLFVTKRCEEMGVLTDGVQQVIDKRVLQSALWVTEKVVASSYSDDQKAQIISGILNDETYVQAYQRQKGNDGAFGFTLIPPQSGDRYLQSLRKSQLTERRKERILNSCPKPVVRLYRKIKGKNYE